MFLPWRTLFFVKIIYHGKLSQLGLEQNSFPSSVKLFKKICSFCVDILEIQSYCFYIHLFLSKQSLAYTIS